ncbi:MAG: (Fe-S)-binding protein [Thermodesulfobacteriota bacterium]
MLIKGYTKSFVRPPNPSAQHLRCFAALDADVTEVLPYLNTILKGYEYLTDPPSLTLKLLGKLVTIHPRKVAINIVKDEQEADEILEWLTRNINETWDRKNQIAPSFKAAPKPRVLDILRLLPKTNCGKCGAPTCMVFAVGLSTGEKVPELCPALGQENRERLGNILGV